MIQQGLAGIAQADENSLQRLIHYFTGGSSKEINGIQFKEGMIPFLKMNAASIRIGYNGPDNQQQASGNHMDDSIPILARISNHLEASNTKLDDYFGSNFKQIDN